MSTVFTNNYDKLLFPSRKIYVVIFEKIIL